MEGVLKSVPSSGSVARQYSTSDVSVPAGVDPEEPADAPPVDGWRGWVVVLGSFFIHIFSVGLNQAFGVFIIPLQHEFHVNRESIVWLNGLGSFVLLSSGILTGYLADWWSYRGTAFVGALTLVVALEVSSLTTKLWQIFLSFGLMLGIGGGLCFIPAVSVISEWFQMRRGVATGVAVSGTGVGTLILPLIAQHLINKYGWRWAMRVLGFMAFVCIIPSSLVITRRVNNVKRTHKFVGKAVVFTRTFLFLGPAIFFYALGSRIPTINCVANADDKGIKKGEVLLATLGAASTVGRIVLGFVADKIGKGSLLVMAVATPFWPFVINFWQYLAFCIVFGLAVGSFIALVAPTAGDYFGTRSIAGVAGIIYGLYAVGTLIGPPMGAVMYDKYRNYFAAALFCASCSVVGFLLLFGLEPSAVAYAKFRAKERQAKVGKLPLHLPPPKQDDVVIVKVDDRSVLVGQGKK